MTNDDLKEFIELKQRYSYLCYFLGRVSGIIYGIEVGINYESLKELAKEIKKEIDDFVF